MLMCFFTNDFVEGFDREYQICSCNRHMWSARSQRVLRARGGKFVLITKEGKRHYVCSSQSPSDATTHVHSKPSKNNFAFRTMKAALLAATYAAMIYSPILLTSLAPLH